MLNLSQIGRIALPVADVDRSEAFYEKVVGLKKLFRFGDLTFFDAVFTSKPHLIAKMDDHDLWMAFFNDPDGHILALMQEAPKGYTPPT